MTEDEKAKVHACDVCGGKGLLTYRPIPSQRNVDRAERTCSGCGGTGTYAPASPAPDEAA